ncbi:MAG: small conductance mechanosensitive channel, partial [Glaciecola sp.]
MFGFTTEDASMYLDTYLIPFGIKVAMAILIYVVGKIVVKILVNVFGKLMAKSQYDNMLIDFLKTIVSAILMIFVIIAALDQLGVNTTSLAAILAAAGLAIGLSLQ